MSETFEPITREQYDVLPGREGGGVMGCVFKYHEGQIVGRRSFDDMQPGPPVWTYARREP